jgi:hypothetical protein
MTPTDRPACYVPVVRVLPADMEGLRHMSSDAQGHTRPLLVIVRPRPRNADREGSFLMNAADLIVQSWRFRGLPFLELYDLPAVDVESWFSSEHPLWLVHKYLTSVGVPAIPVTALYRTGEYRETFLRVVREHSNGMGVRLYAGDIEMPAEAIRKVQSLVAEARCKNSDVDLIVDLERIRREYVPDVRSQVFDLLAATDQVEPYRSITLVGSSLPMNLDGIPQGEDREVPRLELNLWRDVVAVRRRLRAPSLGDYLTVRPEYEDRQANFKHINAKIFYTTEETTRVVRGKSRLIEKLEDQYPGLAARLESSGAFMGPSYSWGDGLIAACARGRWNSGQPMTWVSISISHHLELVPSQITRELARAE